VKESPIFIKSYEMLTWLLNHTKKFPKHQRFVMAKRMESAALDFHDEILRATRSGSKLKALGQADYHLARLKIYNRICKDLQLHSFRQYEHLASVLDEVGRLLGGWLVSIRRKNKSTAVA
jgi:hypothetical protein